MTDRAIACLKQDDLRLFYKGACHVFAVALQRYQPAERYQLRRVVFREMGAYHVYARSGDWLIDVGGLRRESDYVRWLEARAIEYGWNSAVSSEFVLESDLLRAARFQEPQGLVNERGLFTDPEFVSQAMARAKTLAEDSDRYRAILMR
ncbi:MAG TPA: hypothetical protein VGW57_15280 [Chthoniobacterales bacterium]|nr:hypothetical protein [Chthoniobacterales bacterium]